jgi:hypothetical protein
LVIGGQLRGLTDEQTIYTKHEAAKTEVKEKTAEQKTEKVAE